MPLKRIEYKPLSAGKERQHPSGAVGAMAGRTNDILLFDNPDRGYRTTMPLGIHKFHPDPEDPTKASCTCDLITRNDDGTVSYNRNSKCSGKHDVRNLYANLDKACWQKVYDYLFDNIYLKNNKSDYKSKLLLSQGGPYGYNKDMVLPQEVLDIYDLFFENCRRRKIKVLFRLGYHGVQLNWQVSEENRLEHEKWGASEEVMISHIKQLKPLFIKNADVIHKVSSGFIASGGEQAYNYQYPVVNYDNVIKAIVENLCVPIGVTYSVRMPQYKIDLVNNDPDYKYKHLIGFNNDAFYGEQVHYAWESGCLQYKHNFISQKGEFKCTQYENDGTHKPNNWWTYICENAAYTPQSGEMYHNTHVKGIAPSGEEVIKELAHHRHTTLSQWNNYLETPTYEREPDENGNKVIGYSVMQDWIDYQLTTQTWLRKNKIIYDPAWFYDDEGNEVYRNPYEFIRDHLGYKLQAVSFEFDGRYAELTLKNFGFAAAFNLKSGFAVLDENYGVISEICAGEPDKWYSHDPENWQSDIVLEHTVKAAVELPASKGKYYLAFYLKNTLNEYARLSNSPESLPFKNGYHILDSFEI